MTQTSTEIRSLARKSRTTVATVAQMRAHVVRICKVNGIEINCARREASADGWLREVWIRSVRSPRAYATALHEIGHILGRYQQMKFSVMVRERWAWQWARRNALQLTQVWSNMPSGVLNPTSEPRVPAEQLSGPNFLDAEIALLAISKKHDGHRRDNLLALSTPGIVRPRPRKLLAFPLAFFKVAQR
jgi:hypothetical protein